MCTKNYTIETVEITIKQNTIIIPHNNIKAYRAGETTQGTCVLYYLFYLCIVLSVLSVYCIICSICIICSPLKYGFITALVHVVDVFGVRVRLYLITCVRFVFTSWSTLCRGSHELRARIPARGLL